MRQWKESFPGDPFISSGFRCGVLFSRPCLSSAVDWRRCVGHISPTDEATPRSRDICEPNVWRRHFHAQCLERFDHWMMYMCQDHDIHTLTTGTYWDASWNDIGFRVITVLSELLEFISKAPPPPHPHAASTAVSLVQCARGCYRTAGSLRSSPTDAVVESVASISISRHSLRDRAPAVLLTARAFVSVQLIGTFA